MLLHERLKQLREEKDISQEELSKIVNITTRSYQRYEKGEREPSLATLKNIATFYNVTLDYLVGLTNNK